MPKQKDELEEKSKNTKVNIQKTSENTHLGSSNAFEETENTLSRDADNISDEKLDEMLEDE
jgi:small nuclear ribonucleoprotein (snRNP)-like protein